MSDYLAIHMDGVSLAPENDIDDIHGGVQQTLRNRSNFNRNVTLSNRSQSLNSETLPQGNEGPSTSNTDDISIDLNGVTAPSAIEVVRFCSVENSFYK